MPLLLTPLSAWIGIIGAVICLDETRVMAVTGGKVCEPRVDFVEEVRGLWLRHDIILLKQSTITGITLVLNVELDSYRVPYRVHECQVVSVSFPLQ